MMWWKNCSLSRQFTQRFSSSSARTCSLPHILPTSGLDVRLFCPPEEVESQALEQLKQIAESGAAVGWIAAMPDVHLGAGATIGSVFASREWVAPNAVGVDIGCGMGIVRVKNLFRDVPHSMLRKIQAGIKTRIPTGFDQHSTSLASGEKAMKVLRKEPMSKWLQSTLSEKHTLQVGTLGGGNHFLEVVYDEKDRVWLLLHSGSRNIGNITAAHHDQIAKQNKEHTGLNWTPPDLNFLRIDSREGQNYLTDMTWCQHYAFHNRACMLEIMKQVVKEVTGCETEDSEEINIHHNYCSCETCTIDGKVEDVWVTRKGATSARKGQLGIIPGNMAQGSYIVRGLGNAESFQSCSHGAGRKMSRNQAFKAIDQTDFEQAMKGIVCDTHPNLRDEAPGAYKDLTSVMKYQEDLVEIVHRLNPLVNIKGFEKGHRRGSV